MAIKLPNFFTITPPKCASTWLYLCLRAHPDIYVPPGKETHFFSWKYDGGFEGYKQHFGSWKDQKAIGEVSTSYLYHPEAASRIYNRLGKIRLITCLRNPIQRAYSR